MVVCRVLCQRHGGGICALVANEPSYDTVVSALKLRARRYPEQVFCAMLFYPYSSLPALSRAIHEMHTRETDPRVAMRKSLFPLLPANPTQLTQPPPPRRPHPRFWPRRAPQRPPPGHSHHGLRRPRHPARTLRLWLLLGLVHPRCPRGPSRHDEHAANERPGREFPRLARTQHVLALRAAAGGD